MSDKKQKLPPQVKKDESRVLPLLFAGLFCFVIAALLGYGAWTVFGSQARANGQTAKFLQKFGLDAFYQTNKNTESEIAKNSEETKKPETEQVDEKTTLEELNENDKETYAEAETEISDEILGVVSITGKEVRVGGGETQRPVQRFVVEDFLIAETEVTNAQYAEFIRATGHRSPNGWKKDKFPKDTDNYPVVNVTWSDANAFCEWLGSKYKMKVRLPTQAEWELAARGPNSFKYPWGNDWNDDGVEKKKASRANPVKQYEINKSPYGAYDMLGNVWEWTSEQITRKELESETTKKATTKNEKIYLALGGSFKEPRKKLRNTFWVELKANFRINSVGFRYVIIPNETNKEIQTEVSNDTEK